LEKGERPARSRLTTTSLKEDEKGKYEIQKDLIDSSLDTTPEYKRERGFVPKEGKRLERGNS